MRNKIGEIKARTSNGNQIILSIFQEYESYIPKDSLTLYAEYFPTFKSVETQDGQPVNFEPDKMEAQIVTTGELLQVDEVIYIV